MIKYVEGDILLTKAEAIAHGVGPDDDFKQGLALSLRERWPAMYKDFKHYCHTSHPKEGELWSWKGAGGRWVLNLLVQEAPKNKGDHAGRASMSTVNHSLKALAKELQDKEIKSVAITRLATGVGGLPWNEVKPLIEKHLGAAGAEVFVYEQYHKDMQAKEQ